MVSGNIGEPTRTFGHHREGGEQPDYELGDLRSCCWVARAESTLRVGPGLTCKPLDMSGVPSTRTNIGVHGARSWWQRNLTLGGADQQDSKLCSCNWSLRAEQVEIGVTPRGDGLLGEGFDVDLVDAAVIITKCPVERGSDHHVE